MVGPRTAGVARSSRQCWSDDLPCLTTRDGADQMGSTVGARLPSTAKFCSRPVLSPLPVPGPEQPFEVVTLLQIEPTPSVSAVQYGRVCIQSRSVLRIAFQALARRLICVAVQRPVDDKCVAHELRTRSDIRSDLHRRTGPQRVGRPGAPPNSSPTRPSPLLVSKRLCACVWARTDRAQVQRTKAHLASVAVRASSLVPRQLTHRAQGPTLVFAMTMPAPHFVLLPVPQTTCQCRLNQTHQELDLGAASFAEPPDVRFRSNHFGRRLQTRRNADWPCVPRVRGRRRIFRTTAARVVE
jgi:hypothetical protein